MPLAMRQKASFKPATRTNPSLCRIFTHYRPPTFVGNFKDLILKVTDVVSVGRRKTGHIVSIYATFNMACLLRLYHL
jgi:hypothetical protein